jgi:hypothetical protein
MDAFRPLLDWAKANDGLLWWLFAASVALILLTPLGVGWAVIRLPANYFTQEKGRTQDRWNIPLAARGLIVVLKNVFGLLLLLAGVIMLLVPGQGMLTIAVGLILLDFPGKFRLERWLATRKPVWRSLNWLRKRAGREPLQKPSYE